MKSHALWFANMQKLSTPSFVEILDDTSHPIVHTRNIALSMEDGKKKYIVDVFHVPNITKNVVSIEKMVD